MTDVFPIVNSELLKFFENNELEEEGNHRIKWLTGIGTLRFGGIESLQFIPDTGVVHLKKYNGFRLENRVRNIHQAIPSRFTKQNEVDGETYVLKIFISPSDLNENEKIAITKEKDSLFYQGVKNGWSMLVFGVTGEMAYQAGIVSVADLLKLANPEIKKMKWQFVDGSTINF